MKTFRVLGSMNQLFYMDVSANDKLEAYDIAEARNTDDWFEVETDNIIDIVEVLDNDED
jgi:hypothetical protein